MLFTLLVEKSPKKHIIFVRDLLVGFTALPTRKSTLNGK